MKRVLFIGNSHLAAFKQGLDKYSPSLDYEPVFFGLGGNLVEDLGIRGSSIVATSERALKKLKALWGRESFDLSDCDVVAFCGMGSGIRTLHPLVTRFQPSRFAAARDRHVVAVDTYQSAAVGIFRNSLMGRTARNIRKATSAPVYVIPQPAPDHKAIEESSNKSGRSRVEMPWLQQLANSEEARYLASLLPDALVAAAEADLCISQPPETLETPLTTKSQFMLGSSKLAISESHDDTDIVHANAHYGALVLEAVNRQISII